MTRLSTLGVIATDDEDVSIEYRFFRAVEKRTPVQFDDWTVDGVPLRSLVPGASESNALERTFMTSDEAYWPSATESLRALLGEDSGDESTSVRFHDGRVGLLFCPSCGDLGCGALSAAVETSEDTVTWRDIDYQTGFDGLDFSTGQPFSIVFERATYEAEVRSLLRRWENKQSMRAL